VAWCAKELGVEVSYKKLYDWFLRWGYRKKVPRPMAEKADAQAHEAWQKGGLLSALQAEGLRRGIWDHAAFPKGKAVGEVGLEQVYQPPYSSESCGAGIGEGSVVDRREELWEHRGVVGSCGEFFEELSGG
jgi:hypothetical protein